jgi:hypothetical protein
VTRATAARLALGAVLAGVWALSASLLWHSSVPALHLRHLNAATFFSPAELRRTASYMRFERIDWLLAAVVELVALTLYARHGARFARESAAGRMGTGMLLGMLGFALLLVGLGLLALPLGNAITRHLEAEADWSALRATQDPAAATSLFRRFVPTTLDEPNPPTWDYVLRENHPTIMQRLAMVEAWRRYYATSAAQSP